MRNYAIIFVMKKIFVIILLILLTLVFYDAKYIEPNSLVVKNETLNLPHWSKSLDGLRVGVVSDIHFGYGVMNLNKLKTIVDKVNDQSPDIIVLPGDFDAEAISASGVSLDDISDILSELKAPLGVFAIKGNHDYEPKNVVYELLKKSNIKLLSDRSIYLINGTLKLTGIQDIWHYYLNTDVFYNDGVPTILLSHNPDVLPKVPDYVSLTLSGHTHGGEVVFPVIGSLTVPSKYGQKYAKGYVVENGKHLYVTSGVGTLSGFRLCNPPEIVILTLNSQTEDNKIENTPTKGLINRSFHYEMRMLVDKFQSKKDKK